MSKISSGMGIVGILFWLAVFCGVVYGFVANIVKLIGADAFGLLEVVRAIGILAAPLGVVMGYVG